MDRIKTGIPEFDDALSGGIPKNNLVLFSGGPGTGKSTFCLEFLLEGTKNSERGIYITTEQTEAELIRQAEGFKLDLNKAIENKKIAILFIDILKEESIISKVRKVIAEIKPSRIVIDSLSTFSEYAAINDIAKEILLKRAGIPVRSIDQVMPQQISERRMIKRVLASLISEIRGFGATTLLTSELSEKDTRLSSDGISEFLADGVVILYHLGVGSSEFKSLKIVKMRYTPHKQDYLFYELKEQGIQFVKERKLTFEGR